MTSCVILIIKININDKSIFVLYFDISFLFIKKITTFTKMRKLNMEWLIAIGKFGDERFSLFQWLCCTYPLFHEIYKKIFNVHVTLQTRQAFFITLRQPPIIHLVTRRDALWIKRGKVGKKTVQTKFTLSHIEQLFLLCFFCIHFY